MSIYIRLLTTFTIAVLGVGSGPAQAQSNPQVEPDAMAALQKMGGYLRSLKSFQVEAISSTEDVLMDGQKVLFTGTTNRLARMPDRLRIDVESDRRSRLWVYDG